MCNLIDNIFITVIKSGFFTKKIHYKKYIFNLICYLHNKGYLHILSYK